MRVVGGVLALLVLVVATVVSLTRFSSAASRPLALLAALSPYAVVGFALVLLGAGVAALAGRRSRSIAAVAVLALAGVVAQAVWLAPRFVADDAPRASAVPVRLLTANLQFSEADPVRLVDDVRRLRVDVAVLEEVRPYGLELLERAGLRRALPHVAGSPSATASGTMVFSRYPLGAAAPLPLGNGGLEVTVRGHFRLLAAHTAQPLNGPDRWVADLRVLREAAVRSVRSGPTVLAGDLNATLDHRPLRSVLGAGLSDAADQAGSGWQPTWPVAFRFSWTRPLVAIDHVLVDDRLVAVRTRTLALPGSDHRGLLAEIARR